MPDKHEVGGSTPLEPTSRRRRQKQQNLEARERIRKPEKKKDAERPICGFGANQKHITEQKECSLKTK